MSEPKTKRGGKLVRKRATPDERAELRALIEEANARRIANWRAARASIIAMHERDRVAEQEDGE